MTNGQTVSFFASLLNCLNQYKSKELGITRKCNYDQKYCENAKSSECFQNKD